MTKWKIYNEDAVEWAKNYQKGKFHALLCDAPYHLTSIVKRFGKTKENDNTLTSEKVRNRSDGYSRLIGTGFMGNTWDGGDLAFRKETWEAFGEVLYPGAFGMAFSASRNWHRMAVAIEDAGFILHPTIFLWAYGQGFPKATNISKQIEKGKIVGQQTITGQALGKTKGFKGTNSNEQEYKTEWDIVEFETDMGKAWEGHRYGLQALKPAVEPIIVFQKPYEGKPLDSIVSTGAGALNIDGGRIATQTAIKTGSGKGKIGNDYGWSNTERNGEDWTGSDLGRWPANLILEQEGAERLDAQTGTLKSGNILSTHKRSTDGSPNGIYGKFDVDHPRQETLGDSGGASRFFYNVQSQLDESDPVYYCSKVSPKERNAGLDDMPLIERTTQGRDVVTEIDRRDGKGKVSVNAQIRPRQNTHPTLKPIDLCRYLATLLLPPVEYAPRRLFVPFSGVGSEMVGAGLAGWEQIVGCEFDTENGYVDIAEKRLQHWLGEKK